MPSSIVQSYAKKTGKSEAEVEKKWDEAKASIVKGGTSESASNFYPQVVAVLKKMLGVNENINEDGTTAGAVASTTTKDVPTPPGVLAPVAKRVKPDCTVMGMDCFEVDANDFFGASRARATGSKYNIRNDKVVQYQKERQYRTPFALKYGEHIIKVGKNGY